MRWMGALLLLPLALGAQAKPDDLCSIGGQVSNASTGEPVRRALVYLRRIDSSPGVTNIQISQTGATDARGRFAITGIAPGKYRLSAERSGFIATQYGSRGPGKAGTLLTLEAGQKSSELVMSLTPGAYFVVGVTNTAGKTFSARTPIQVGSSNIEGISLAIRGGVPVSGRVRVEGETTENIARVRVTMQPAETGGVQFGPIPNQQVKEDGSFQLEDVGADRYTLLVNGLPEGFYVKSVRSANIDVLAGGLDISGGSPAPLDVVLSPNAGQVTGTVMDPKTQKAAAAMTVVLVPREKERRDREAFYRTTNTDPDGRFTFKTVTPGEYRVYAWEEAEYGAWMDPDFLKPQESRGESVSLQEGGRQAVQLNLIPADSQ